MLKNAFYRNLKETFADLLPCYCYTIKTNSQGPDMGKCRPGASRKVPPHIYCNPVLGESHIQRHANREAGTKGTRITKKWLYSEVQSRF